MLPHFHNVECVLLSPGPDLTLTQEWHMDPFVLLFVPFHKQSCGIGLRWEAGIANTFPGWHSNAGRLGYYDISVHLTEQHSENFCTIMLQMCHYAIFYLNTRCSRIAQDDWPIQVWDLCLAVVATEISPFWSSNIFLLQYFVMTGGSCSFLTLKFLI